MRNIAVVLVLVALAAAQDLEQLTSIFQPLRTFYSIVPVDENGASVGNLILRKRDRANSVAVDSHLKGLPCGQYFGLFHDYGKFNGTCDMTSSPIKVHDQQGAVRRGVAFGVINVDSENHWVTMDNEKENAVADMRHMFTDKLVYIYPLPSSTRPLNEIIDSHSAPLPRPVACGIPRSMAMDDPDRPKPVEVDITEVKESLSDMIEVVAALMSNNKDRIVAELLNFIDPSMTANPYSSLDSLTVPMTIGSLEEDERP